jgi:chlorophyllide a reductase subunit X
MTAPARLQAFAEAVGIPVLAAIPADEDIRRKSANYEIIGKPDGEWGPLFEELASNVAEAPPLHPEPLDQDGLAEPVRFDAETGAGSRAGACHDGRHVRVNHVEKPSLEVIYDNV